MRLLGRHVAPEVLAFLDDGYAMEMLDPAPRSRDLLLQIEHLLAESVWSRPAPELVPWSWQDELFGATGVRAPDWATQPGDCVMTHGDPTVSNAMVRSDENQLVLADPRPPRAFAPPSPDVDCGKILQSVLGWEVVAYGEDPVNYDPPMFWNDEGRRRRALFWCGVACKRIWDRENARPSAIRRIAVKFWAQDTADRCFHEACI